MLVAKHPPPKTGGTYFTVGSERCTSLEVSHRLELSLGFRT